MAIEQNLGYFFFDKEILKQALTPPLTIEQEAGNGQSGYQILGNHLIQMVVTELLIRYGYSDAAEIQYCLSQLVNPDTLSAIARSLQIDRFLRLSPDEQTNSQPDALLAATLQAAIGGVYFDGGFRAAAEVVKRLFGEAFTPQ